MADKAPNRNTDNLEEPPVLTSQDEEILDRVWENVGKELSPIKKDASKGGRPPLRVVN